MTHQSVFVNCEVEMNFLVYLSVLVFCLAEFHAATLDPIESLVIELDENTEELPIRLIKQNPRVQNLTLINAYPIFLKFLSENLPELHELNLIGYKDDEVGYFGCHFELVTIFQIGFRGESLFPIGITLGNDLHEFTVEVWSKLDSNGNLYDTDDKYIDLIERNVNLRKLRIMAKRAESTHPFQRLLNVKTKIQKITIVDYKHISKEQIIQLIEHNTQLGELEFVFERTSESPVMNTFMKNIWSIGKELRKHFGEKWNIEVAGNSSKFTLDMNKIKIEN